MNYRELIDAWHLRASSEDYFSKFVFEYLAFIAYLKTQKYSSNDTDRRAIQRLKRDNEIRREYLQHIRDDANLKRDWQHVKDTLDRVHLGNASRDLVNTRVTRWWNCSHDSLNQKTDEEKQSTSGVIHSLNDWANMVEFWYTIRNNLFHGAKNPEDERDQFAVKYAYKTLSVLMDILLH